MSESDIDLTLEQWRERGRSDGLTVQRSADLDALSAMRDVVYERERALAYQHGYEAGYLGALRERVAELRD